MVDRLRERLKSAPHLIFYTTLIFVIASIGIVLFIDVTDPGHMRSEWIYSGGTTPDELHLFFWWHWFEIPIENPLQWAFLSATIALFLMTAGAAHQRQDSAIYEFSILITAGLVLMLIEDVADPRHILRTDLGAIFGEGGYGYVGTFVELAYFAMIGAVMMLALVAHRRAYWRFPRVRRYLLSGYVFYAIAVSSSWLGSAFRSLHPDRDDLYTLVGQVICDFLFLDGGHTEEQYRHVQSILYQLDGEPLGFYFMDRLYEESLELLGASALLVAALSLFLASTKDDDSASAHDDPSDDPSDATSLSQSSR